MRYPVIFKNKYYQDLVALGVLFTGTELFYKYKTNNTVIVD